MKNLPEAFAHFPFTDGSTAPVRSGIKWGVKQSVPFWEKDERFGVVPACKPGANRGIILSTIPYAESGRFSINIWFKAHNLVG